MSDEGAVSTFGDESLKYNWKTRGNRLSVAEGLLKARTSVIAGTNNLSGWGNGFHTPEVPNDEVACHSINITSRNAHMVNLKEQKQSSEDRILNKSSQHDDDLIVETDNEFEIMGQAKDNTTFQDRLQKWLVLNKEEYYVIKSGDNYILSPMHFGQKAVATPSYKTQLNVLKQRLKTGEVVYETKRDYGEDHQPEFLSICTWMKYKHHAHGRTKRNAEENAAKLILDSWQKDLTTEGIESNPGPKYITRSAFATPNTPTTITVAGVTGTLIEVKLSVFLAYTPITGGHANITMTIDTTPQYSAVYTVQPSVQLNTSTIATGCVLNTSGTTTITLTWGNLPVAVVTNYTYSYTIIYTDEPEAAQTVIIDPDSLPLYVTEYPTSSSSTFETNLDKLNVAGTIYDNLTDNLIERMVVTKFQSNKNSLPASIVTGKQIGRAHV